MKKVFLFCTELWLYLTEIPPILLLWILISYNDKVDSPLGLYPLIFFTSFVIIGIFLYFFRIISLSCEELRALGPFSSRDSAVVNKDKTIVLTIRPNGKIRVVLLGDGGVSEYAWAKDEKSKEIALFRESAIGGDRAAKRVLKGFSIKKEEIDKLFSTDTYEKDYDFFVLSSSLSEKTREIKIHFTETI